MMTKLLLAAAVSALSLGAAQAAPVLAQNDIATQSTDSAIEQVHHRYYGYYYNPYYYNYYNYYRYCYWSYGYKYCY